MNTSILGLLAATFLAPSFASAEPARVLTMLRMDVDGDGKDDVIQVIEKTRPGSSKITDRVFQVQLAKTGKIVTFAGLLSTVTYKPMGNSPCHSGVNFKNDELKFGSDMHVSLRGLSENSFEVNEEYEDEGCSYYGAVSFQASLNEKGEYQLEKAHRLTGHSGMGSGYMFDSSFEFGTYGNGHEELMDKGGDESTNGKHEWKIPETCAPKLNEIVDQKIPACAEYKKP